MVLLPFLDDYRYNRLSSKQLKLHIGPVATAGQFYIGVHEKHKHKKRVIIDLKEMGIGLT